MVDEGAHVGTDVIQHRTLERQVLGEALSDAVTYLLDLPWLHNVHASRVGGYGRIHKSAHAAWVSLVG